MASNQSSVKTVRPRARTGPSTTHRMFRQEQLGSITVFTGKGIQLRSKASPSGSKSMRNMF